jgi:hypothetical protein
MFLVSFLKILGDRGRSATLDLMTLEHPYELAVLEKSDTG